MARSQGLLCPGQSFKFKYLSVKWVVSQLIVTLEGVGVSLNHDQIIFSSFEYLCLVSVQDLNSFPLF